MPISRSHAARRLPLPPRATALIQTLLLVAPLLLLTSAAAPRAEAGASVESLQTALPTPRYLAAVAEDGLGGAYLFGGHLGSQAKHQIVRYDGPTAGIALIPVSIAGGREGMAAAWVNGNAYLFGGSDGTPMRSILRFDPAGPTLTTLPVLLPRPLTQAAAVTDGTVVYLFGGHDGQGPRSEVLRFDPVTGTLTEVGRLPTPTSGLAATWVGDGAILAGGEGPGSVRVASILRFNPTEGSTTPVATLPVGLRGIAAAWDGHLVHLVGGDGPRGAVDHVFQVDPAAGTLRSAPFALREGRSWAAAASLDGAIHLFGGCCPATKEILRFPTPPAPPTRLAAERGIGQVTFTWDAPSVKGSREAGITGYRVYAGAPGGALAEHGVVPIEASTVTFTALAPGEGIAVAVASLSDAGESARSPTVTGHAFRLPTAPRELVARSGPATGEITLRWLPPLDTDGQGLTAYHLYAGAQPDHLHFHGELPATASTDLLQGLPAGEIRYYRLAAVTAAGESPWSNEASAAAFTRKPTATLPEGLSATSAVWTGFDAFVFGGLGVTDGNRTPRDTILQYDVQLDALTVSPSTLPVPVYGTSAAWAASAPPPSGSGVGISSCHPSCYAGRAYLFGGTTVPGTSGIGVSSCHPSCMAGSQIVAFDPLTGEVAVLDAVLPSSRWGTSAVAMPATVDATTDGTEGETGISSCHPSCQMGGAIYVFGGAFGSSASASALSATCDPACGMLDEIVRFDPATEEVTVMGARLPQGRYGVSAAPSGGAIYLFGGRSSGGVTPSDILRYDPATDTLTPMGATLPAGFCCASAVPDRDGILLAGGLLGGALTDRVFRYDPATDSVREGGTLPSPRSWTSAVSDGTRAYIFGGEGASGPLDEILAFPPGAPRNVRAAPTGAGEITVTWEVPLEAGEQPVTGYRVYRGTTPNGATLLAEVSPNTLSFTDPTVPPGATRYYKVSSLNRYGESPQSLDAQATAHAPPGAPENAAGSLGPAVGEVTVTWSPPQSDGGTPVTGYHLYRRVERAGSTGAETEVAVLDAAARSYTDPGCPIGATCHYDMSAENLVGIGERSRTVSLTPGTAVLIDG